MTTDDDPGRALAESLTYVALQAHPPQGLVERLTEGVGARPRHRGGLRWAPLAAVAAVLAQLVLSGIVVLRHDPGPVGEPPPTGAPPGGRSAALLASARWTTLPDAPIEGRSSAVGVWTGSQMLVWGGETTVSPQHLLADGASYDPATRVWHTLPAAPISARSGTASVWTGKVLFVWGGYTSSSGSRGSDGATYDPVTRTWHMLPPAPEPAYQQALALTVGDSVFLVTTPPGNDVSMVHLQEYRPDTNTWVRLPDLALSHGHVLLQVQAVSTGDRIFLWSMWARKVPMAAYGTETLSGVDGFTFDVAQRRWSANGLGSAKAGSRPLWTGHDILFPAAQPFCGFCAGPARFDLTGQQLDPTTNQKRDIPHGPVDTGGSTYAWTGEALLGVNLIATIGGTDGAISPAAAAVWDPAASRWTRLPDAPLPGAAPGDDVVVWTGRSLLIWGSFDTSGSSTATRRDVGLELK